LPEQHWNTRPVSPVNARQPNAQELPFGGRRKPGADKAVLLHRDEHPEVEIRQVGRVHVHRELPELGTRIPVEMVPLSRDLPLAAGFDCLGTGPHRGAARDGECCGGEPVGEPCGDVGHRREAFPCGSAVTVLALPVVAACRWLAGRLCRSGCHESWSHLKWRFSGPGGLGRQVT